MRSAQFFLPGRIIFSVCEIELWGSPQVVPYGKPAASDAQKLHLDHGALVVVAGGRCDTCDTCDRIDSPIVAAFVETRRRPIKMQA